MEYFDTYEEAKAAYPDCDEVICNGPNWDLGADSSATGKFSPIYATVTDNKYVCCGDLITHPCMGNDAWVIADKPKQPKTRTEYISVDEKSDGGKYWECARDFAYGSRKFFFMRGNGGYDSVRDNGELLSLYENSKLIIGFEKEIDWRDEVATFVHADYTKYHSFEVNGIEMSGDSFLEMCRVALRATGELEG